MPPRWPDLPLLRLPLEPTLLLLNWLSRLFLFRMLVYCYPALEVAAALASIWI